MAPAAVIKPSNGPHGQSVSLLLEKSMPLHSARLTAFHYPQHRGGGHYGVPDGKQKYQSDLSSQPWSLIQDMVSILEKFTAPHTCFVPFSKPSAPSACSKVGLAKRLKSRMSGWSTLSVPAYLELEILREVADQKQGPSQMVSRQDLNRSLS